MWKSIITALGPDNVKLADPIIHHVTGRGARIAEIQMYDHDEEQLFAMLCRIDIHCRSSSRWSTTMRQIGDDTWLGDPGVEQRASSSSTAVGDLLHLRRAHSAGGAASDSRRCDQRRGGGCDLESQEDYPSWRMSLRVPFRVIGDDKGVADDDGDGPNPG